MTWQPPAADRRGQGDLRRRGAGSGRASRALPPRCRHGRRTGARGATALPRRCSPTGGGPAWTHFLRSADQEGRLNAVGARMALQTAAGRLMAGATITRHLDEHPEIRGHPDSASHRDHRRLADRNDLPVPPARHGPPAARAAPLRTGPARLCADRIGARQFRRSSTPCTCCTSSIRSCRPSTTPVRRLPEECVLADGHGPPQLGLHVDRPARPPTPSGWQERVHPAATGVIARCSRYSTRRTDADGSSRRRRTPPNCTASRRGVPRGGHRLAPAPRHRRDDRCPRIEPLRRCSCSMYSDEVDAVDVGRYQADATELWLRRAGRPFRGDARSGGTFVDVAFSRLERAVGAIRRRSTPPPGWRCPRIPTSSPMPTAIRNPGIPTDATTTGPMTSGSTRGKCGSGSRSSPVDNACCQQRNTLTRHLFWVRIARYDVR